ncbi:thiamine pyrophosphate-dependent enzyme [Xanthobacteraceae bacterium Astr-EGSB]|uniref:thiamine pyrophosphate-dependent enzyme n=1 Tax=Astrobacterium formosum TaxID=3069710 RepID=UPI0027B333D8|nr:thiamine pyrophosphate-dependent enzyme [Xanthobacteraceae bacterium Astr-EGSB]
MGQAMIDRREFVRALLVDRGGLIVVTGLGSSTYDVAAAGDHPLNVYQWGGMGGTLMVGLGLALARPDHRVVVITGDGDALMGIGSLATIGVKQPQNLAVVVLDNGHYGETGMQASHTHAGIDLVAIATACRFRDAIEVDTLAAARPVRDLIHKSQGPVLVKALVKRDPLPRVLPTRDGHEIRVRFKAALGA